MAKRASEVEDHYGALGVGPEASVEEIRRAYRAKAMAFHPDRMAGASDEEKHAAGEKLKAVNLANEVLSDPAKRHRYHAEWLAKNSPPRPVVDSAWIGFDDALVGETMRASFVIKNLGGPYQRIRISNPDSWVRVTGYQSLSEADELPLRVDIEAQGGEWDKAYMENISVVLDDQETQVAVELRTTSGPGMRARRSESRTAPGAGKVVGVSGSATRPRRSVYEGEAHPRMIRAINTASASMKYVGVAGAVVTLLVGTATVVTSFPGASGIFMAVLTAPLFGVVGALGGAIVGGVAGMVVGAVYGAVDRD